MSFGSPILGIVENYVNKKFERKLEAGISEKKPKKKDEKKKWRQIFGETFMGEAMLADERFEWICPANFYQSEFNETLNLSQVSKDKKARRYRDREMPVNHNYFVNMRLSASLKVYAGYGAIVVHSVDLNGKTLEIVQDTSFDMSILASESLPFVQITNNYGKGYINIDLQYNPSNNFHLRSILHGGNDKSVNIKIKNHGGSGDKFEHFDISNPPPNPKYKESPKSGEESEKKSTKKSKSLILSRNDIFVYIGLVCFIFSLVFLILPFFVRKNNDFYLLEHYDYYQDCDELQ
ncbi:unnamed protein product [Caenorhabditis angaria]|uniref:Uncharacterized protein n=1 Tax=Caenorhabditis angaria TaxID=860376 RepID=A0A9P1IE70_9PELO|nr:unnamed protein product [Caenorhabditis angaria]